MTLKLKALPVFFFLGLSLTSAQTVPQMILKVTGTEEYPGTFGSTKIKYEKITGQIIGELDPLDPHNAINGFSKEGFDSVSFTDQRKHLLKQWMMFINPEKP